MNWAIRSSNRPWDASTSHYTSDWDQTNVSQDESLGASKPSSDHIAPKLTRRPGSASVSLETAARPALIYLARRPTSFRRHGLEHSPDSRAKSPEFPQVSCGQQFNLRLAQRRKPHLDPPPVSLGPRTARKAPAHQAVHEANGAMVP